jgi:CHAD domain-containing protein
MLHNWEFQHHKDPIEALHDLRVASRRLRALLEVFGHLVPEHEPTRRQLRQVTRIAGPLREADVNAGELSQLRLRPSSQLEAASLEHVCVHLDAERDRLRRRATRRLGKISTEKLQRRLYELVEALVRALLVAPLSELAEAVLSPRVEGLLAALPAHGGGLPAGLGEELHVVRIHIKRLRYAVELLAPLLGEAYEAVHAQLKGLQQDLGRHHDLFVLYQLLLATRDGLAEGGFTQLKLGLAAPLHHLAAEQIELAQAFLKGNDSFDAPAFRQLIAEAVKGRGAWRSPRS